MVQRTKRGLSAGEAAEMKAKLKDFHSQVRMWCARVPIGTTTYVALDNLNSALLLTDGQLNAAIDGDPWQRPFGKGGVE